MTGVAAGAFGFLVGLVLAATGLPLAPGAVSLQAVVNSGHRGAVLDIAQDPARGLLFSGGEDGTLRVWDAESRTLLRRIAVTRRMTGSVALDPAASRAAVVIADQVRSYAVEVWDWETSRRVASIPLDGAPLFVRFSQSGTYLLCGQADWKGLRIFRASDGSPVPFHPEGFGMVGFAETSKNDATLMTYQPSGKIDYWDMAGGSLLQQRETRAGLSGIRITGDRRLLIGDGRRLGGGGRCANGGDTGSTSPAPGFCRWTHPMTGRGSRACRRDGGLRLWELAPGGDLSRGSRSRPGPPRSL